MKYSMSIAMVAILMAAAFAGVLVVDDEADAVSTSYTIGVSDADKDLENLVTDFKIISNETLKNDLKVVDGKITGTVTKAPSGLVKALWGTDTEKYVFVFTIGGLMEGTKVIWVPSSASDTIPDDFTGFKGLTAGKDGKVTITMKTSGESAPEFEFIMTANPNITVNADNAVSGLTYDQFKGYNLETIGTDFTYIGNEFPIEYTVGDLTYIQKSNEGMKYSLVTLDALNANAPAGKKFVGWADKTNTYPAGTVMVLPEIKDDMKGYKFTAVFEDVPEITVTFKDGTSTLNTVNVADLSVNTIPPIKKVGYTFDGWFMGEDQVDPLEYAFTESVTLVAQWTPVNCAVTFVAGDFVKIVTVLYGDRVQELALPAGYDRWDFDFSTIITEDETITAVEKAPAEPTGLKDPTNQITLMIVGLFACIIIICLIIKRDEVRAYGVKLLTKKDNMEDKKE